MTNRTLPVEYDPAGPGAVRTVITTYGEIHGPVPPCTRPVIVIDLREILYDPAVDPHLIHLTGLDEAVRQHVLNTPGAQQVIEDAVGTILAAYTWARSRRVRQDAHVLCRGGRHRAVVIAEEIGARLRTLGHGVEVEHRDIGKPVTPERRGPRALPGGPRQIEA